MGNTTSTKVLTLSQSFLIDRILVANLNNIEGKNLVVGVFGGKTDDENPLQNQGIRIGDNSPIFRLKNFSKSEHSLRYEFESDVTLSVTKRDSSDVIYNLKTPSLNLTGTIDKLIRERYKNISMSPTSNELDTLSEVLR